ncbi:MAG: hypothetical protein CMI31_09400 [Opitutae bacterium]|nr:hypothetical protein [Opitutae bacterium]|tara:strand:+ start:84 stop:323 length:240 start_codon:yes stop_codon:yes gene_type:complete
MGQSSTDHLAHFCPIFFSRLERPRTNYPKVVYQFHYKLESEPLLDERNSLSHEKNNNRFPLTCSSLKTFFRALPEGIKD